jgi:ABC-2 type transport system permease protein
MSQALRDDRLLPSATIIARREFAERVRGRLFAVSTILLASLAMIMALTPILIRVVDRGTTTTNAIVTEDDALAARSISVMSGVLNTTGTTDSGRPLPYSFVRAPVDAAIVDEVVQGRYDGALVATRLASGQIAFRFVTGPGIGADRASLVGVGALAVAILDWTDANRTETATPFSIPTRDVVAATGPTAGGQPIAAAEYASRRIVGVVFVVLIFITLVIYGMWVAAAVVAEKSSRVMELLISAASPRQLVVGKVVGIGLAGMLQFVAVVVPALAVLIVEDRIAAAVLGTSESVGPSLAVLTPGLLAAYGAFWVLGFVLYSLIYAAAGSLVSRPEDLQVIALPLSLIAIAGYLQAVAALSGGLPTFIRLASYVPFWSPFVMLTRLTVGRVEPWELVLAYGLLLVGILLVGVLAVRVYAAGVLLYGQRPGFRAIAAAILRPAA